MSGNGKFRFSIDRGGTFTDVYAEVPGKPGFRVVKLLSEDPDHYEDAPLEGIRRILQEFTDQPLPPKGFDMSHVDWVRMGTTVATNALLERKGARTGLVITRGFGDLLRIGKQNRPRLFDLKIIKPQPLFESVVEVDERVRVLPGKGEDQPEGAISCPSGDYVEVLNHLDSDSLRNHLKDFKKQGIESLAVVLMHSYIFPDHEQKIGALARELGFRQVTLSSEVMSRIKMVDRGQTCCLDAYLTPHIKSYLEGFRAGMNSDSTDLLFMQSDGGLVHADRFRGSNAILSGPAGGVVGYAATAFDETIRQPVIGFDMGGTSTDISRYDGAFDWVHETEIAGVQVQAPQLDIRTVAAGGGSRLFFKNEMLVVGPESSGAHPGPVCYRKRGHLSLTDVNLVLGRLLPEHFPKIFGPRHDQPLDVDAARSALEKMTDEINRYQEQHGLGEKSMEDVALGFVNVANEVMAKPIREVSVERGHDVRNHTLACFGGAGGQHACAIARALGIQKVKIHRFSGILSAFGLGKADVVVEKQEPAAIALIEENLPVVQLRLDRLQAETTRQLLGEGFADADIEVQRFLNLRFEGSDTSRMVRQPSDGNFARELKAIHQKEFGFIPTNRTIWVDDWRVRSVGRTRLLKNPQVPVLGKKSVPIQKSRCYFEGGWRETPVYLWESLCPGEQISGPAILLNKTSTVLVELDCRAELTSSGDIEIDIGTDATKSLGLEKDPVSLAILGNRFMSIAEQMGRVLQRTAVSTNIKERHDFSCAVFDATGGLVANAPHQPVHLGSMGEAVKAQILQQGSSMCEGDVFLSNHPGAGGTHLPDMTVITPVIRNQKPIFFVASRGHHADIGGISPGSMPPFSKKLQEEGAAIRSFKLVQNGVFQEEKVAALLTRPGSFSSNGPDPGIPGTRALEDNLSDLKAQVAANQKGIELLRELVGQYSLDGVHAYMKYIQESAEMAVREVIRDIHGSSTSPIRSATDFMDDGTPITLGLKLSSEGEAEFDFSGTGLQVPGNINSPLAVTYSAILYCLRCLVKNEIPLNQGCLNPIQIKISPGTLLCPSENAAVAAGNVLTSQRVVDVVFKALGVMAAAQGCMNNLTFGNDRFGYYETIGGGAGAGPSWHGQSGVHTHMTNTRITDPEILEKRYPVLLREFSLRRGSGGKGLFRGGEGLIRDIEFLEPLKVAILSERRVHEPYGIKGGESGKKGQNWWVQKNGNEVDLGGKNEFEARPGDRIRILTPGGGGFGLAED